MPWILKDKEFESLFASPARKRYEYCLKRVADEWKVWSLRAEKGWVKLANAEGREIVPIWPHERYARACALGAWQGAEPAAIPLKDWMERWIPGLEKDHRDVAVFPTGQDEAIVVSPGRLKADLDAALSEY